MPLPPGWSLEKPTPWIFGVCMDGHMDASMDTWMPEFLHLYRQVSVAQSYPILCDPMECSPPGCSVSSDFPPGSSGSFDFPGKNTGVSCHLLFQGIFPSQELNLGFLRGRQILYRLSYRGISYPDQVRTKKRWKLLCLGFLIS